MKLKDAPVECFWRKASIWRKLSLLRSLGKLNTPLAQKYLREMRLFQNEDGGFGKEHGKPSSATPTAEAILNLIELGEKASSSTIKRAVQFLWSLQKENGSWRENPALPKEKVPFWSSTERGVPILTADAMEALVEAGYRDDKRLRKAAEWLKGMQSPGGMLINLENAAPTETDPDSTQRAIRALINAGENPNSPTIRKACNSLEKFILTEAEAWAKKWPMWSWVAPLDGLVAAGFKADNKTVQHALEKIVKQQGTDGGWPDGYEVRVVPTLIELGIIPKEEAWGVIRKIESSTKFASQKD